MRRSSSSPRGRPTAAGTSGWAPRSCRCTCWRRSWRSVWAAARPSSGSGTASPRSRPRRTIDPMSLPAQGASPGFDLEALDALTGAVESGAGLPEVIRAAARALDASLVLADRTGAVLAVAARSPADERSLMADAAGVERMELRVADEPVGTLRMRARSEPGVALIRLVTTLVASEVERVRAPQRASDEAASAFVRAALGREFTERDELVERGAAIGLDLAAGASVVVARAHPQVPVEDGWRAR